MRVLSLKAQLTLIALVPLLITIIFIFVFVLQEFSENVGREIDAHAETIAAQASHSSEFYMSTGEIYSLREVARNLLKIEGVAYVRYINNDEELLLELTSPNKLNLVKEYHFPLVSSYVIFDNFTTSRNATVKKKLLGSIELGISASTFNTRLYQIYDRILLLSFTSLILGSILLWLFTRKVTAIISDLISTAQSIEYGRFDSRCKENGAAELLKFQKTFNTMARSFEENEQELKAKIESATTFLKLSIEELSEKNNELDKSRQETISLERSKAISDERERIMRDMHDGIGGQLVASLALLEQESNCELTDSIHQILRECLDDLRLIIDSLNASNESLADLLADFKYKMNKKLAPLKISLVWHIDDIADNLHVPPQMSLHLLRIFQEVFTNIIKHANATQINFDLNDDGQDILIKIQDNGHFQTPDIGANGIGLTNMKNRARLIDADIQIQQTELEACTVTLRLPKNKLIIKSSNSSIE